MKTARIPPKPISEVIRPDLVRVPRLHGPRRLFRGFLKALAKAVIALLTHAEVRGLEHFPRRGPALIVTNHLGDGDAVIALAALPVLPEAYAKIELWDFPVLGWVLRGYGVIWVHRGRPDRRALRAGLQVLQSGGLLALAPEGRYSLTGGLERGMNGAAYLALRANVPIVPVTFTGTENANLYPNLKRLRKPRLTLTVGEPFRLPEGLDRRKDLDLATEIIMLALARQLPPRYRGVYADAVAVEFKSDQAGPKVPAC